jgi:hypothetical protein
MSTVMNNGNGTTTPTLERPLRLPTKPRNPTLLWKMIGVAVVAHLVLILATSTSLFSDDPNAPDKIFDRAEAAMNGGKYLEAMDLYQQVLDKQPKLPPVFERAAEQHRAADRLAKQQAAKLTATKPTTDASPGPTTHQGETLAPVKTAQPATKPEFVVPPEFRRK